LSSFAVALGVACDTGGADELATESQPHTSPSDGAILYQKHCSSCHGVTGKGKTIPGPGQGQLGVTTRDLTDPEFQRTRSDEQLRDVLSDGQHMMPGFASVLDEEAKRALVRYVRALGGAQSSPDGVR
jgi:mono/diheme cytochrome c family protein